MNGRAGTGDLHERAGRLADAIEAEMRRSGFWQEPSLPEEAYRFTQAFAGDTMTVEQWLQFLLLPRVREIVATRGPFPGTSDVAVYAARNFDGVARADRLLELLAEFDRLFSGR